VSDDGAHDNRKGGTYLFVRPRDQRRQRAITRDVAVAEAPPVAMNAEPAPPPVVLPPLPVARDAAAEVPPDPREAIQVRHVRPRLSPQSVDARLFFLLQPDAAPAEEYRALSRALRVQAAGATRMWVVGARPGAGATLTCLNLAAALSETMRVTVVEVAPKAAIAGRLGLAPPRPWDPESREPLDLWLVGDRLAVLCSAELAAETDALESGARVLAAAATAADIVLIDGPGHADAQTVARMAGLVDAVVLVVRPGDLGTGAYEHALTALHGLRVVGVVVNGAPMQGIAA